MRSYFVNYPISALPSNALRRNPGSGRCGLRRPDFIRVAPPFLLPFFHKITESVPFKFFRGNRTTQPDLAVAQPITSQSPLREPLSI